MCDRSIAVWFVCKLCQSSFGQVDAFIEHKKEEHFTEFQNTTSIVFEETEHSIVFPAIITNDDHELADESNERQMKVEVNDDDPIIPFSSEIIDEPNFTLVEPKNELITFESEMDPDDENSFFDVKQPEQNPYVLLKRLTTDEIQSACDRNDQPRLLAFEQKNLVSNFKSQNLSADVDRNVNDLNKAEKSTESQPTATVEHHFRFECKLCSKQLESDAQLKVHMGICALYHQDRNRFCVICNRKFSFTRNLKDHRLRFHGTEEEKLSLFKFKCHICPKQYRHAMDFRFHLKSHKEKKKVETSNSKLPKSPKCSHPNCGKEFPCNSKLQYHISTVHMGVRNFSCSFPNCNKKYARRRDLENHSLIHTKELSYKCTVDSCNKAFITSDQRLLHHRTFHCNLLKE